MKRKAVNLKKIVSVILCGVVLAGNVSAAKARKNKTAEEVPLTNVEKENTSAEKKETNNTEEKKIEDKNKQSELESEVEQKKSKKNKKDVQPQNDLASEDGVFTSSTVKKTVGSVRFLAKGNVGTFQIYAINRDEKAVPLLAGYDEFTSSYFSMMTGKKVYKLTNTTGIVIGTLEKDDGIEMVYVVPDLARLIVKMQCMNIESLYGEEVIKVTCTLRNKGKKTEIFALKQLLDTYLGEQIQPHFKTAENEYLNSEVQFRRFDKVKYVCSKNKQAALQIMLDGADISRPESVILGNKDYLSMSNWMPTVMKDRSFDSVISYNNSAVLINWENVRLAPQEEVSYTYYMAVSTDSHEPKGMEFVEALNKAMNPEKEIEKEEIVTEKPVVEKTVKQPPKEDEMDDLLRLLKEPEPVKTPGFTKTPAPEVQKQPEEEKAKKIRPEDITNEQLNPDYIQKLLDRINELEKNDKSINRKELVLLNAELDAILLKLGQQ